MDKKAEGKIGRRKERECDEEVGEKEVSEVSAQTVIYGQEKYWHEFHFTRETATYYTIRISCGLGIFSDKCNED